MDLNPNSTEKNFVDINSKNNKGCCTSKIFLTIVTIATILILLIIPIRFLMPTSTPVIISGPFYNDPMEKHFNNIINRTKEVFADEIASNEILSYKVEFIYSFGSYYPRFFIVELEYKDEYTDTYQDPSNPNNYIEYSSKYSYTIGLINASNYDKYMINGFINCQSPYSSTGSFYKKKYYSKYLMAVEDDSNIIQIISFNCPQEHENSERARHLIDQHINICPTCYGKTIKEEDFYLINAYDEYEFYENYLSDFSKPRN